MEGKKDTQDFTPYAIRDFINFYKFLEVVLPNNNKIKTK